MGLTSRFLIDNDEALLGLYPREQALPFPFPWSFRRIGYVDALRGNRKPLRDFWVKASPDRWRLPEAVHSRTAESFDTWLATRPANQVLKGYIARLADCTDDVLSLQNVAYEDYARSNLLLDHIPTKTAQALRALVTEHGALETLTKSSLANPLGISLIAINQDDEIPLQVRANSVVVRPGEICSTSSGTFELSDIPVGGGLLSACNLMRETVEEMGPDFASRLSAPDVLGLGREFARGGQPELFLSCRGTFTRDDVLSSVRQANRDAEGEVGDVIFLRLERDGDCYDANAAATAIARLEAAHPIAAPLRCHLAFLFAALARDGMLR